MKYLITTIAAVVLLGCGESVPKILIHQAAYDGNIEAVKQHLDAGTDVNARAGEGETPLNLAALMGHKEIVGLLIAKGADVNAKDYKYGITPLLNAAMGGHKETAELLIAEGADVKGKDVNGSTPLHSAAFGGSKEIVELLIANGADVNVRGFLGKTPLNMAVDEGKKETAALLRKHGGKTGEELKAEGK